MNNHFLFEVSLLPYICSDKVIFIILTVEVISADLQGSKECYSLCCSMPSVLVLGSSLLVSFSETSFQDLYLNNICSWLQVYLPYLQVLQGCAKIGGSRKEIQGRVTFVILPFGATAK